MNAIFHRLIIAWWLCLPVAGHTEESRKPYIPYDVTDAVRELDRILTPEAKSEISSKPVGMMVRNRWIWQPDSRLARYFNTKGVYNGDLMWGIIVEAYRARGSKEGSAFDLRTALRNALGFSATVNIPVKLPSLPAGFHELHISHYIQRDDLSAIHVFSSPKGDPKWAYFPDAGWFPVGDVITSALKTPAGISVPQPHEDESPSAAADPFQAEKVPGAKSPAKP